MIHRIQQLLTELSQAYPSVSIRALHMALGHLPILRINKMILNNAAIGLPSLEITGNYLCVNCELAKSIAKPLPSLISTRRKLLLPNSSYKKFEVVAFDIVDIGPVMSIQGNSYYVVLLDFNTNYSFVYFMKNKSDLLLFALTPYMYDIVNPLEGQIVKFQCDD